MYTLNTLVHQQI